MSESKGLVERVKELKCRIEPISGQRFSYVKLDDILAILENANVTSLESELAEARALIENLQSAGRELADDYIDHRVRADVSEAETARLLTVNARQAKALEPFASLVPAAFESGLPDGWQIILSIDNEPRAWLTVGMLRDAAGHEQAVTGDLGLSSDEVKRETAIAQFMSEPFPPQPMTAEEMREACAKIADSYDSDNAEDIASEIRALPLASPGKGAE